jgi:folate-binding Fe-S cluster repair protein YgfZ
VVLHNQVTQDCKETGRRNCRSPIAVRNNTGIYTPSFFLPWKGKYYPHIILYSEGKQYKIIDRFLRGDLKDKHIQHALKRFIHHRYAIHKKVNEFKDEQEMFDFILEQEEIKIKGK